MRSVLTLQLNERLFYAYVRTMEYSLTGLYVRLCVCVCSLQVAAQTFITLIYTIHIQGVEETTKGGREKPLYSIPTALSQSVLSLFFQSKISDHHALNRSILT